MSDSLAEGESARAVSGAPQLDFALGKDVQADFEDSQRSRARDVRVQVPDLMIEDDSRLDRTLPSSERNGGSGRGAEGLSSFESRAKHTPVPGAPVEIDRNVRAYGSDHKELRPNIIAKDRNGNMTEVEWSGMRYRMTYDNKGRLSTFKTDANDDVRVSYDDAKGRQTLQEFRNGQLKTQVVRDFNRNGQIERAVTTDERGVATTITLNKDGRITSQKVELPSGAKQEYRPTYEKDGRFISSTLTNCFAANGNRISEEMERRDNVSRKENQGWGTISKSILRFDENDGSITKRIMSTQGTASSVHVEMKEYGAAGKVTRLTEYDYHDKMTEKNAAGTITRELQPIYGPGEHKNRA